MNGEILNKAMIIEVYDDQRKREYTMRYILSDNIKLVSVCDHLDRSMKEQVGNRYLGNKQVGKGCLVKDRSVK